MFSFIVIYIPFSPNSSFTLKISFPYLVKLSAIISILYFKPKFTISSASFSVTVGKSTIHPGRFIFFFSPSEQSFSTLTITDFSLISVTFLIINTVQTNDPSAIKIYPPTLTDYARF